MTILVDQPIWELRGRRFAHLASDVSFAELHRFARVLGLPRRAFHHDHYDLPGEYVPHAVDLGAHQVDARELTRRLRGAGLRRRSAGRDGLSPG